MAREDTRIKILKAAEKLFSKNGYDGVATKAIAKEAGITEMTLFNHFPKKTILYTTVIKERYMSTEIKSIFADLTFNDLEKDLVVISNGLVKRLTDNKNILLMRLKERESLHKDSAFKLERDPVLSQIVPVFKLYGEKGIINGSGESDALLFMASLKGLFYVSVLDDKNDEEIRKLTNDFVIKFCNGVIKR